MTLPLDGLDFDVIVLAGIPYETLTVINAAHSRSGHDVDQDHWGRIGIGPRDDSTNIPAVETIARLGIRPTGPARFHATAVDDDLSTVAAHAVRSHLMTRRPPPATPADVKAWSEDLDRQAHHTAAALDDPGVWTRTTAAVDGRDYALWLHLDADGFAACADLGYALVSVHGTSEPPVLAFRRLTPANVLAVFA